MLTFVRFGLQENLTPGKPAPLRTLNDLLRDSHDVQVFDYYAAAQVSWAVQVLAQHTPHHQRVQSMVIWLKVDTWKPRSAPPLNKDVTRKNGLLFVCPADRSVTWCWPLPHSLASPPHGGNHGWCCQAKGPLACVTPGM